MSRPGLAWSEGHEFTRAKDGFYRVIALERLRYALRQHDFRKCPVWPEVPERRVTTAFPLAARDTHPYQETAKGGSLTLSVPGEAPTFERSASCRPENGILFSSN